MTRSQMMANIGARDTKPEMMVRRYLHGRGLRYRVNDRRIPGKPDLVFPRYRTTVFVHGCFWHRHAGCRLAYLPKTRTEFWVEKFDKNVVRDVSVQEQLQALGWSVALIWECTLRDRENCELALANLYDWIEQRRPDEPTFRDLSQLES